MTPTPADTYGSGDLEALRCLARANRQVFINGVLALARQQGWCSRVEVALHILLVDEEAGEVGYTYWRDSHGYDCYGYDVWGIDAAGVNARGEPRNDPARFRYYSDGRQPNLVAVAPYDYQGYDAKGYNRAGSNRDGKVDPRHDDPGYSTDTYRTALAAKRLTRWVARIKKEKA